MSENRETTEPNQMDTREPDESSRGEVERPLENLSKEELIERLVSLQKDWEEACDSQLRSRAEMENMKKRHQKDKEEWRRFALEKLIKDLLPVLDNLEKALEHARDDHSLDTLMEGVELTLKGLKEAMGQVGLEEVKAEGETFDPCFHEAISVQEDPGRECGTILHTCQKGYTLNQRLIRPSLVVVNKGAAGESRDPSGDDTGDRGD